VENSVFFWRKAATEFATITGVGGPTFLGFPALSPPLEVNRARMDSVACLPTLDELRRHVLQTLCTHDCLDPTQTPLTETLIMRRGKPCGLFFHAQGPRMLKTHAVWAGEEDRILFYDSTGIRFGQVRLSEAPDLGDLATTAAASKLAA
jgi:hypothetical protein